MDRHEFRALLQSMDLSQRAEEIPHRDRMLMLLDSRADCFLRSCFPGHFTGSALVVSSDGEQVLLHHHKKLDRWLQFGGHCDGDEDLSRVAQREALEECGIPGLILASSRPFDLDIHEIPARGGEPVHFHYDVRYVLIAPEGEVETLSDESLALRWFTGREVEEIMLGPSLQRLISKWQALLARRKSAQPSPDPV